MSTATETTRVQRWQAELAKAVELLGDVEPVSMTFRFADEPQVHLRKPDFFKLFAGQECTRECGASGYVHWSRSVDGILFTACERPEEISEAITLPA